MKVKDLLDVISKLDPETKLKKECLYDSPYPDVDIKEISVRCRAGETVVLIS